MNKLFLIRTFLKNLKFSHFDSKFSSPLRTGRSLSSFKIQEHHKVVTDRSDKMVKNDHRNRKYLTYSLYFFTL